MKNTAKTQKRDQANGQYVHADLARMCVCGHTLGNHSCTTVARLRDCFGATPGQGECERGCQRFRPAEEKRPKPFHDGDARHEASRERNKDQE